MSDFYSFADGEISNLTFFTHVYSITYSRVCDKSHGVDRSYGKQLIAKVDIQRHKYHTCNSQSF